jgi:hypothetical protein
VTLQVDPGHGVPGENVSSLFAVAVNGQSTHCYSDARTTEFAVPGYWAGSESVEVSCARFGTDAEVTVVVTRVGGGAITSADVFPRRIYRSRTTVGASSVTITMPVRGKCCVVINGTRKNRLYLCADNLAEAEPVGGVVYDGTQVSVPAGTALIFPVGKTNLVTGGTFQDKLFPVGNNATVYLRRGAWVIGSFSIKQNPTTLSTGARIIGPGNLSGEWTTRELVAAMAFEDQQQHALLFGFIASNYGGNCEVRGITMWKAPFHHFAGAWHRCYDVGVLTPWTPNSDAFPLLGDPEDDDTVRVHHCFCWNADDSTTGDWFAKSLDIRNNLLSTAGGATMLCGYQQPYAWDFNGYSLTYIDNYVITCGDYYTLVDEDSDEEGGAIVQGFTDAPAGSTSYGRFNVTIDGLYVDGDAMNSVLFNIGNRPYSWGAPLGVAGQCAGWTIRNVETEAVPAEISKLRGLNRQSCPNGIAFENIVIAGQRVTVRNFSSFFTVDEECYGITIDGRDV